jgi:hypothetical protein
MERGDISGKASENYRDCKSAVAGRAVRRMLLTFLAVFHIQCSSFSAIAFDAASTSSSPNTTTLTWSHTTGTGSDRILLVSVVTSGIASINSVTYAGVPMTLVRTQLRTPVRSSLWVLSNPPSGTGTIAVTASQSSFRIIGGAQSYSGVDRVSPFGAVASTNGFGNTASLTLASNADELVVDAYGASSGTAAPQSPQVSRYSQVSVYQNAGSSRTGAAPTVTMSWSSGSLVSWTFIAVSLKPSAPLPVNLLYFRATAKENSVRLQWSTATEQHNQHFTLERSDGHTFETLITIDGAGNSTTVREYSWEDSNPPGGTSYYRLSQTDYNGLESHFPPVAVSLHHTGIAIRQAATEDNSGLACSLTLDRRMPVQLHLIDAAGKVQYVAKITGEKGTTLLSLDTGRLQEGIYLLHAETSQGSVVTKVIR